MSSDSKAGAKNLTETLRDVQTFVGLFKKEAKSGELALVVTHFVIDTTHCHGFGQPRTPMPTRQEVIGVVKGKPYLAGMFEKRYAEKESTGEWLSITENSIEEALTIYPNATMTIVKVNDGVELYGDILKKHQAFSERINKEVPGYELSLLVRNGVSEDKFRWMEERPEITIYFGQDAILDYLVSHKEPLRLVQVFRAIGIQVPTELNKKAMQKAREVAKDFYESYYGFIGTNKMLKISDDQVATPGRILDNGFINLSTKAERVKNLQVSRFIARLEIDPAIEFDIKKALKYVASLEKVRENKSKSF